MSVNGVDITQEVGTICGSIWIVFYIALIWFVWARKPTTLVGRRWKASWLIGGLPVLAIPLIMSFIILGILVFQSNLSKFDPAKLSENLSLVFSFTMGIIAYAAPLSIFMALLATLGTYLNFKNRLDYWLEKIVPPSKDEKTDSEVWY